MGRVDWKKNKFDIDLKFGHKGENHLVDIFENESNKIEVKTDRLTHKTGNIAIEIRYKGNPSGLSTTEADYWITNIYKDDTITSSIITNVKSLKENIKNNWNNYRKVHGGDDDQSLIVLIPLAKFI